MKKLMILAALAATTVAFGATCSRTTAKCVPEGPWAYQWKFTGKTTDGVKLKDVASQTSLCGRVTPGTNGEIMRVPASLAIQGYTYVCDPCCITEGVAIDKEAFVITKPAKEWFGTTDAVKGGVTFELANIIGKTGTQIEMLGNFKATTVETKDVYDFTFAGFGKYDLKNIRIASVSGNFAGNKVTVHSAKYAGCPEAIYWDCCATKYASGNESVAFGTWSMKFNASAAKKYGNGYLAKLPILGTNY